MYRCDRHNTGDMTETEAAAHHFMHVITGDVIIDEVEDDTLEDEDE